MDVGEEHAYRGPEDDNGDSGAPCCFCLLVVITIPIAAIVLVLTPFFFVNKLGIHVSQILAAILILGAIMFLYLFFKSRRSETKYTPTKPCDDTLRMAYKEYSDELRHFSTVRSALTTFLVTVSLAACSAFFNRTQSHPFLVAAALIFALAALVVCWVFSWRTSKALLRRKRIWEHFTGEATIDRLEDPKCTSVGKILTQMRKDSTNWFLLGGLGLLAWAFYCRDSLSAVLPVLP